MYRKLIVTADDFGLTEGVNAAIVLAHRNGIVTSASLMPNGPAFESAVAVARANPTLNVGLHLNLTEGRPVSDHSKIPSLARTEGFIYHHPLKLWLALWNGRASAADVDCELRAQIEKALKAGVQLTHVDGHKHVHGAPAVLGMVCRAAAAYGIKAVRSTVEGASGLFSLLRKNPARQVLKQYVSGRLLSMAFGASVRRGLTAGFAMPARFYGVTQTGFLDFDAFANILRDLPSGVSELMCHPGYADVDLQRTPTRLLAQRERELGLLTGPEVRKLIERENVQLAGYLDLVFNVGPTVRPTGGTPASPASFHGLSDGPPTL